MPVHLHLAPFSRKLALRCVAVPVLLGVVIAFWSSPLISHQWLRVAAGLDMVVLAVLCVLLDRLVPNAGSPSEGEA
jgi:hypothetical protein